MGQAIRQFAAVWKRLGINQKVSIVITVLAVVAGIVVWRVRAARAVDAAAQVRIPTAEVTRAALAMSAMATDAEAARGTVARALDVVHDTFSGVVLDERVKLVQVR